jgi:hypothetical protein
MPVRRRAMRNLSFDVKTGSGSFLKKRTKKLLLIWVRGGFTSTVQTHQKFFAASRPMTRRQSRIV